MTQQDFWKDSYIPNEDEKRWNFYSITIHLITYADILQKTVLVLFIWFSKLVCKILFEVVIEI